MNPKRLAALLALLLVFAIGFIVYLLLANQDEGTDQNKGYNLVYERQDYRLFVKDTIRPPMKQVMFAGGERVPYPQGYERIKKFLDGLGEKDDTTTRYIDFTFDSLMSYMTYVIEEYKRRGEDTKDLGLTVYIGMSSDPVRTANGREVHQRTILLRPTKGGRTLKFIQDKEFDFFNQGSICPVNCPEGRELDPPLTNGGQ